jgi:hypothetical protein
VFRHLWRGTASTAPKDTVVGRSLSNKRHRNCSMAVRLSEYIRAVESHLGIVIEMFARRLRKDHGHRISPPRGARAPA